MVGEILRVGVLASGRGSNLEAILEACASPGFPARVVVVAGDQAETRALRIARERDIPSLTSAPANYPSTAPYDLTTISSPRFKLGKTIL